MYLGLPLWVWLVVIGMIMYNCYLTTSTELFTPDDSKIKIYNFNTNWCGYSKQFQPEWDKFTDMTKSDSTLSNIVAIDVKCDGSEDDKKFCQSSGVEGYPYVAASIGGKMVPLNGQRSLDGIVAWAKKLSA